jgi:sphinganine C4-monooxygenase
MAWWDGYISDDVMGTIAPLVVYWLYAGLYHMLPPLDRFRLHSVQEEEQRNLVTLPQVVKGVLLQQAVQSVVAFLLFAVSSFSSSFSSYSSSFDFLPPFLSSSTVPFLFLKPSEMCAKN